MNLIKRFIQHTLFWPMAGLVLLLLINLIFNPGFFAIKIVDGHLYGSLVDILHNGAVGMILAIGMCLVIASGGIDLSVGSVMAICGAAIAVLLSQSISLPVSIVVTLVLAVFIGAINGLLVAKIKIQPIIATLILMVAGRGVANFITGEKQISIEHEAFSFLGGGHLFALPMTIWIVATLFILALFITRKTSLASFIEVCGDNEKAGFFAGVNISATKFFVYGFCGLCAGLAGLLETSNLSNADPSQLGVYRELDAIFAVVVGGTALSGGRFSLIGAIIGAILLQTLTTTMYSFGVDSALSTIPKALVIIGVCLIQSEKFRERLSYRFKKISTGVSAR